MACLPSSPTTPTGVVSAAPDTVTAEPSPTVDDGAAISTAKSTTEALATAECTPGASPSVARPKRGLDNQQKCLLTFTCPWWLQGEAGIPHQVRALLDDHGMDYSAAGLDCALAWLLIQRRVFAVHLRAWLAARMTPGHDPARILDELDYYLLSLGEA